MHQRAVDFRLEGDNFFPPRGGNKESVSILKLLLNSGLRTNWISSPPVDASAGDLVGSAVQEWQAANQQLSYT